MHKKCKKISEYTKMYFLQLFLKINKFAKYHDFSLILSVITKTVHYLRKRRSISIAFVYKKIIWNGAAAN